GYVRERLHETNRAAVLCVSERYGAPGEALALLRETPSSVERLLVLAGGKLTRPLRERLIPSESNAVTHDRTDVDFVLLDDHQLLVGGTRSLQRLVISICAARPLLAHAAWLPHGTSDRLTHRGRVGDDQADMMLIRRAI